MAKKKKSVRRAGASKTGASGAGDPLAALREKIDRIDGDLVTLLNRRAALALKIGHVKNGAGRQIYDPRREEEVLDRVAASNGGPLSADCLRAVFREVISGSRAVETQLKVSFLGPLYSYSHLAALERFGHGVHLAPSASIAAVFEEVNRGLVDYGIVPIENSTDGRIIDTLGMFSRLPVRICGEAPMRIHHCLLGRGQRADVHEVYSKPQAISQCRGWIAQHLAGARVVEVTSTSTAAQLARDKPGAAAIASRRAGVEYGLEVLAENIEDNPRNVTRFAVIGRESSPRTGDDKCALLFQVPHRAGALADAMVVFKEARLNLTWIESFPVSGAEGEYLFFVETIGHETDAKVRKAQKALEEITIRLEVLGSYPRTPLAD